MCKPSLSLGLSANVPRWLVVMIVLMRILRLSIVYAIPDVIIQYGASRTATTLQFEILGVLMFVKLYDNALITGDFSKIQKARCTYGRGTRPFLRNTVEVRKTHFLTTFDPSTVGDHWLYATANQTDNITDMYENFKSDGWNIKLIQAIHVVEMEGYRTVYRYQGMFDLSHEQMKGIVEFMRYWEILRQCCGVQMSAVWRKKLYPEWVTNQSHHHSTDPACEMYDIDKVEQLFLNTKIAQRMKEFRGLESMVRPSTMDAALDGTYCSRYNQDVANFGLGFNAILPKIP